MRNIEIIGHDDNRLTEDFINEVDFFGSVGNYTRRDYLYVSHIYRDGKEVARIHNVIKDGTPHGCRSWEEYYYGGKA